MTLPPYSLQYIVVHASEGRGQRCAEFQLAQAADATELHRSAAKLLLKLRAAVDHFRTMY